jgi:hypothetical protein
MATDIGKLSENQTAVEDLMDKIIKSKLFMRLGKRGLFWL